jgi:hypothetical protein
MELKEFSENIPDTRRRQLNQAILKETNGFLQFFYQILEQTYIRYKSALQQQQQQQQQQQRIEEIYSSREIKVPYVLLITTLRTLSAFVEWAPLEYVVLFVILFIRHII